MYVLGGEVSQHCFPFAISPTGTTGPGMSYYGAVEKVVSPFLPPGGGGESSRDAALFLYVCLCMFDCSMLWAQWVLGLYPPPGAVLCCVYVSPLLQISRQEGLACS